MKGDFSQLNFGPDSPWSSVLMQQGRVQLDSDWNAQALLLENQRQQLIQDLLGGSAAPSQNAGFRVAARGGLSFDGRGQYVHVPDAARIARARHGAFTIEVFLSARAGGKGGVLVSKSRVHDHRRRTEYLLALLEDGRLLFERTERAVVEVEEVVAGEEEVEVEWETVAIDEHAHQVFSTGSVPFGRVVHVAAVCRHRREGSEIALYLDGRLVGHSESGYRGMGVPAPLWFGAEPAGHHALARAFDGQLLSIRLWRAAREEQELRAALNHRLHGSEPHLVADWCFDEGRGDITTSIGPEPLRGILGDGHSDRRPDWLPLQFFLSPGRCYVVGLLCENRHELSLQHEPGLHGLSPYALPEGVPHLFFLEAWPRLVTAIEDPSLREVALGGPDTTARLRTAWQVRLLPLAEARSWMEPRLRSPALSARCVPSGYTLENTLYRVEIHTPGQLRGGRWVERGTVAVEKVLSDHRVQLRTWHAGAHRWAAGQYVEIAPRASSSAADDAAPPLLRITAVDEATRSLACHLVSGDIPPAGDLRLRAIATFKWSRNNGATTRAIEMAEGKTLRLSDPTGDDTALAASDWIEVVDERYILQNLAQPLLQIDTVDTSDPAECRINLLTPVTSTGTDPALHPFVRRWDRAPSGKLQDGVSLASAEKALELEYGVEITFHGSGYLCTGDYWPIPTRTTTENVEWPCDAKGNPEALPAFGPHRRYASLALVRRDASQLHLDDLRHIFTPLGAQIATEQIHDHAITRQKLAPEVWEEVQRIVWEMMNKR